MNARLAVEVAALVATPAALAVCAVCGIEQAALLSALVALASLALLFAAWERSRPRLRDVMPVAVLAAAAAAGRILCAPLPDFKPVSALAITAGAVFGRASGFMVGALAALASNFFFGQGAWTPWQMYAWGLIGYLAGVFYQLGWLEKTPAVCAYGFASGLLFGLLLNGWSIIGFFHPQDAAGFVAVYAAAFPWDALHGVSTVVFLLALYVPLRRKLERVKSKYALGL